MSSDDDSVDACELGKREYWDETYARELRNLEELDDEGEIWFGEDVMETMADWTVDLLHSRTPDAAEQRLLDVGCGNGAFLLAMADRGFSRLVGVDYSAASVQLAVLLAKKRGRMGIEWHQQDILDFRLGCSFDVITDKGTLDAVGLSKDGPANRVRYRRAMHGILAAGGLLVITSCNSTLQELREEFCSAGDSHSFVYVDHVRSYPTFRFGGHEGTKVSTIAFEKKAAS